MKIIVVLIVLVIAVLAAIGLNSYGGPEGVEYDFSGLVTGERPVEVISEIRLTATFTGPDNYSETTRISTDERILFEENILVDDREKTVLRRTYSTWKVSESEDEAEPDTLEWPLHGKIIDLTFFDDGTTRISSPGENLSEIELDAVYEHPDWKVFLPLENASVGDSWSTDSPALCDFFGHSKKDFLKKAEAVCRLDSVDENSPGRPAVIFISAEIETGFGEEGVQKSGFTGRLVVLLGEERFQSLVLKGAVTVSGPVFPDKISTSGKGGFTFSARVVEKPAKEDPSEEAGPGEEDNKPEKNNDDSSGE